MRTVAGITLFFTARDPLSNWHLAPFEYRGHRFNCVEQFMMFSKAKLFGDDETAVKILAAKDQKTQKALGREVRGFDEAVWVAKRRGIVSVGCREKFRQNPDLLQVLLATGDTILAEASPYDRIWGIGLGADDARALDPKQWRGANLLGQTLMDVRRMLAPASAPARSSRPCCVLSVLRLAAHREAALSLDLDLSSVPEPNVVQRLAASLAGAPAA